jgi:acyl-CoA reductase-like NAD-dependent aldehyde dehydrogenase
MQEEIFGPVLPIITFVDFDEVINDNIKKREKPLAIYYFGSSTGKNYNRILDTTSSGACVANDILT